MHPLACRCVIPQYNSVCAGGNVISYPLNLIRIMSSSALPRLFAVVPAAGHSRRMGRPKLLLPLGSSTVIASMLAVLKAPAIAATVVVVRPADEALRAAVAEAGAIPVQPAVAPEEMRQSVEHALRYVERRFQARPDE